MAGAGGIQIAELEEPPGTGVMHLLRVLGGLLLLLIPGLIAFKGFLPDGELPEALGMVPALSAALLSLVAILVLAVARAPFTSTLAFVSLVAAAALASVLGSWGGGLSFGSDRAARP